MEIIIIIISIALDIVNLYLIFWIISNIKAIKNKTNEIERIKIKHLWEKIDKLENQIKELEENKNNHE